MKKNTSKVFGMSRGILSDSYVDRSQLDEKISQLLERDVHIVIRGASKCGKSWLRQKNIMNSVVIQCRSGWGKEDLYKNVLCQLENKIAQTSTQQRVLSLEANAQVEAGVPLLGKTELSGKLDGNISKEITYSYTYDVNNIQYISDVIKKHKKRIVIEDFHYLAPSVRNDLAFDLKAFWELDVFIIIIGVWTQSNMLIFLNSDLSGRVEEISIDWDSDDMKMVAKKGGDILNVSFTGKYIDELIASCYGSIGLFQVILLKTLDKKGIRETQSKHIEICDPDLLYDVCIEYAESLRPLYEQFARILSEGIRKRPDSTGIYAQALDAIFNFPDKDLINGLSRDNIFRSIQNKDQRIQSGNLHTILCKFEDIQSEKGSKTLVLSYNDATKELSVVDRQILFYRKYCTAQWPWNDIIEESR